MRHVDQSMCSDFKPLKSGISHASLRNCSNSFITARIIASLDFISAVQYLIHFLYHFIPISTGKYLNGGMSQGTKLGLLLFAVTVNALVLSWAPSAKFVDDLTVLEVVPRNSPSLFNFVVNKIESYAVTNNTRINPVKCKELSVDFLRYSSWN